MQPVSRDRASGARLVPLARSRLTETLEQFSIGIEASLALWRMCKQGIVAASRVAPQQLKQSKFRLSSAAKNRFSSADALPKKVVDEVLPASHTAPPMRRCGGR